MTRSHLLLCAALLVGCAHAAPPAPSGAEAHRLADVPFFPDDTDQCGPAALAGVLTFWGAPTAPQNLRDEVYLSGLRGSLPMDLVYAAEARGFDADLRQGTLDQIKSELRAGRPVIALLELGFPRTGHYVLLTGYEDGRGGLYGHSGEEQNEFWSYEDFAQDWERAGRWLVLVHPRSGERPVPRPPDLG